MNPTTQTIPQLIEETFGFTQANSKVLSHNIEHKFKDGTYLLSFKLDVRGYDGFTEYLRHVYYHPIGVGKMFIQANSGYGKWYKDENEFSKQEFERQGVIDGMIKWIEDGKPER